MADKIWGPTASLKGYVTTLESIANKTRIEIESRLGFSGGSLNSGYAVYALDDPVGIADFEWRDRTRYSAGWRADPTIEFGSNPDIIWSAQRKDELRAALGRQFGYDEKKVDAEINKVMTAAAKRLNIRSGPERIVKLIPAASGLAYPDSPYLNIPQWELKSEKRFHLIDVELDIAIADKLSGKAWWHANQATYPNSSAVADLAPGFREKVETFIAALRLAGAIVTPNATLRNKTRAHLMHYSFKLSKGKIKAKDVPAVDGCDIVWDHGIEEKSRKAAKEMVDLFKIVFQPSLTSLHISGLAIDMNISWTGTMKIVDSKGVTREIGAPANGAGNAALHKVGGTYGVHKLLSDAPHWSSTGH